MAVVLTDAQKAKLVKVEQLATFKSLADNKYLDQILAVATQGSFNSATTVEAALIELANKASGDEITFEKLSSPNTGKLASYRFTKGSGAGATTMDIDIEKDLVNKNFQLVSITEGTDANTGHYFDGVTEVGSGDGVTGAGVYMKYTTFANDGIHYTQAECDTYNTENSLNQGDDGYRTTADWKVAPTLVVSYANMAGVIEYLTVGTQTNKAVTLSIVDHQITADIAEKAILKSHLELTVQDTLDAVSGKAEKSEMSIVAVLNDATKKTITLKDGLSQDVLVAHQDISGKADKIGEAFDEAKNYVSGLYVRQGGKLWKFNATHSAGAWVGTDADEVTDNLAVVGADGNLKVSDSAISDFKTKQNAIADITASAATAETGSTVYFLSGISQNANGEISASKKKIEIANDDDIRAIYGLDPVSNS